MARIASKTLGSRFSARDRTSKIVGGEEPSMTAPKLHMAYRSTSSPVVGRKSTVTWGGVVVVGERDDTVGEAAVAVPPHPAPAAAAAAPAAVAPPLLLFRPPPATALMFRDACDPAEFVRYLTTLLTDPGMNHPIEYRELLWAVSNLVSKIYAYRSGSLYEAIVTHFPQAPPPEAYRSTAAQSVTQR